MKHRESCRRGWFDSHGWHDGDAPAGVEQWHSATCEGPLANVMYARTAALNAPGQKDAEAFMLDTIPNLEERAMRFGFAMRDWLSDPVEG